MFGVWGPLKGLFLPACKHHHLTDSKQTEQRVCPVASMQKNIFKTKKLFKNIEETPGLRGVFATLWHVYHSDLKCAATRLGAPQPPPPPPPPHRRCRRRVLMLLLLLVMMMMTTMPPPLSLLLLTAAKTAAAASQKLVAFRTFSASQSMSGRASGGAVKRERDHHKEEVEEDEEEDDDADELPLTLLAVVKSHFDMLVLAQLCNPQGVDLLSFVRLPPLVHRPFAGAPVYDMSLTRAERLRAVGCGFKGKLVRLLSLGVGRHIEPHRNRGACRKMMQSNVRRVAAGLAAAVLERAVKEAQRLLAAGQRAAAAAQLQRAIILGHLPSRAHLADLFLHAREGDKETAFALAEKGARLGCHHCQGVLAECYLSGAGCSRDVARSLALARQSAGKGSKYGQVVLGRLYRVGVGGFAQDYAAAFAQFRLAAAQGYDVAQCCLGEGDYTESLRLYKLAAAQGLIEAMYNIGHTHMKGSVWPRVAADNAEANRWYTRAAAALEQASKLQIS